MSPQTLPLVESVKWTVAEIAVFGLPLLFYPIRLYSTPKRVIRVLRPKWSLTVLWLMTVLCAFTSDCSDEEDPRDLQPIGIPHRVFCSMLRAGPFVLLTPESPFPMTDPTKPNQPAHTSIEVGQATLSKADATAEQTIMALKADKVRLQETNERLSEELDTFRHARGLSDQTIDRVGCLYPMSEREARLIGRDEMVMLAAVAIAIVKVIAEDEGKEATPEFVLDFVSKAREPYLPEIANPQPTTGNPR